MQIAVAAAVITGVIGAAGAVVAATVPVLFKDDPPAPGPRTIVAVPLTSADPPSGSAAVKPIDLVVRDPPSGVGSTVEITVHNVGQRRSIITRLDVTVQESLALHPCDTEAGGLPVSEAYDLALPPEAAAGTEFQVPVSQQQGPDEGDRFALRLGLSEVSQGLTVHLYRLKLELEADGAPTRIPVGVATVALPGRPDNNDAPYYWNKAFDEGTRRFDSFSDDFQTKLVECMKSGSAVLEALLTPDAELSPAMTLVKADIRR